LLLTCHHLEYSGYVTKVVREELIAMPAITVEDILVVPRIPRPDSTSRSRPVAKVVTSSRHAEGAGFSVARPFPGDLALADADPFLLLDHVGPLVNGPEEAKGAPWHPHRGIETVSYILEPAEATLPSDVVAVGRPARVIRTVTAADLDRLRGLRDGDLSVPPPTSITIEATTEAKAMGQLYAYLGIVPTIARSAVLFPTAEITGDVVVGERTIIGAGVKSIGDSHGPVRIGNDVQILENTVLHLLPDNELVIDDHVTVGPGAMIHGCRIGARSVIEPGAIVCDGSVVGTGCVVRAGAVVKQRSRFAPCSAIDGFPAVQVGRLLAAPAMPSWAFRPDDLPVPTPSDGLSQ
jgi:carbonic anhydrase/acetyltransferase-like protein (isoleucine patch superfamily)